MASPSWSLSILCLFWALLHLLVQSQGACVATFNNQELRFQSCKSLNGDGSYMLSWNYTAEQRRLTALFQESHDGWLALGFSPGGGMVMSNTLLALRDRSVAAGARPVCYFLGSKRTISLDTTKCKSSLVVEQEEATYNASHLSLFFVVEVDPATQDATGKTRIIYGKGDSSGYLTDMIEQHDSNDVFQAQINFFVNEEHQEETIHVKSNSDSMKQSHAILQIISFGILLPLGPLLPRYFKDNDPFWYYAHVATQAVGFVLGTAGFSTGLVLRSRSGDTHMAHYGIGVFVFILVSLQVLALCARPKKDAKTRPWWNLYHQICGRLAIFFGIINIFIGFTMLRPPAAYTIAYSLFFVCFLIGTGILEFCLPRGGPGAATNDTTGTMRALGGTMSDPGVRIPDSLGSRKFERLQSPKV